MESWLHLLCFALSAAAIVRVGGGASAHDSDGRHEGAFRRQRKGSLSALTAPPVDLLLPRVALGEAEAIQACISRYGGLVWTLARRLSASPAEAEDAVQEIFVDLWRSAHRFEESRGNEATFIAVIARRRLIDRKRAERRKPQTEPDTDHERLSAPASTSGLPQGEAAAEVALAARALGALSDDQREVLLLSAVDGLSHEEIATSKGMALGTVKSHARRALLRMRELLASRTTPIPGEVGVGVGAAEGEPS
jgi:RNA polymerase sigma-70 factor, ECF subfamily